jgi:hypothetical protein
MARPLFLGLPPPRRGLMRSWCAQYRQKASLLRLHLVVHQTFAGVQTRGCSHFVEGESRLPRHQQGTWSCIWPIRAMRPVHILESTTTTHIRDAKSHPLPVLFAMLRCSRTIGPHLDASAADHAASGALWRSSMEPPAMLIPFLVVIPSLRIHSVQPSAVLVTCVVAYCSAPRSLVECASFGAKRSTVWEGATSFRTPRMSRRRAAPMPTAACSPATLWKTPVSRPAAGLPLSPQTAAIELAPKPLRWQLVTIRCSWRVPVRRLVRQPQSLSLLLRIQARPRSSQPLFAASPRAVREQELKHGRHMCVTGSV